MRKLLLICLVPLVLSGCKVLNPSTMLRTPKDYKYTTFSDSTASKSYKISPNDRIEFRIYANKGFKLIDLTSLNNPTDVARYTYMTEYLVEYDGYVKLPIIGNTMINGLTVRQAEKMLEEKYATFYVDPFVMLKVVNKRIIIFPGSPGDAKVINLANNSTTLLEGLALSGGIAAQGKAYKIKLIREKIDQPGNPDIYLIDLSTIAGIKQGEMILQANDIIYVEPRQNYSSLLLREITPVLSLATSLILAYGLILQATK